MNLTSTRTRDISGYPASEPADIAGESFQFQARNFFRVPTRYVTALTPVSLHLRTYGILTQAGIRISQLSNKSFSSIRRAEETHARRNPLVALCVSSQKAERRRVEEGTRDSPLHPRLHPPKFANAV